MSAIVNHVSMNVAMNEREVNTEVCCCPTCGASQSWRDECRRCGTEIVLLRRLAEETMALQRDWAAAMKAYHFRKAEEILDQLRVISPNVLYDLLQDYTRRLRRFTDEFYFTS